MPNRRLEGVVHQFLKYADRPESARRGSINFGILVPLFAALLAIGLSAAHWMGIL